MKATGNLVSAITLAAAAVWSPGAHAQDSEADTRTGPKVESTGGDIVVTARRREELLQNVPVAVIAVSGEDLERRSIHKFEDIKLVAPGFNTQPSVFGNAIPGFALRGQRQFNPYLSTDASVAIYFAEVPVARAHGINAGLYDLASVQVVKGPQGTLFGRNTTGGAVIITPQAPREDLEGRLVGQIGSYDLRRLNGMLNLPLTENLQVRLAGQVVRRDGWSDNPTTGRDLNDEHNESWRASVRFAPTPGIQNITVVDGFHANENGAGYKLTAVQTGGVAGSVFPGLFDVLTRTAADDFHDLESDLAPSATNIRTLGISNITTIDLGDAQLKNIFGYHKVRSDTASDFDGSPFPVFLSKVRLRAQQWSNELQVSGSTVDGNLDYIAGGFYFLEKGSDRQSTYILGGAVRGVAFGDPVRNLSRSLFTQLTYRIPQTTISFTAGGRYTWDRKELAVVSNIDGVCAILDADVGGTPISPCLLPFAKNYSKATWLASVDWKPSDDVLLYATVRNGYRSGGFNISAKQPSQFLPFQPENVTDIELGAKTSWSIGGLRGKFNVAAYRDKYKDIQRSIGQLLPNNSIIQLLLNAAEATMQGVETEVEVDVSRSFKLHFSHAYIDAHYDKYIDPTTTGDLTANKFGGIPKNTFSAAATWTHELGPDGSEVSLNGNVFHQSHTFFDDRNINPSTGEILQTAFMPGYTVVNVRAEWRRIMGSGFSAAAFVNNVTDEDTTPAASIFIRSWASMRRSLALRGCTGSNSVLSFSPSWFRWAGAHFWAELQPRWLGALRPGAGR